MSIKSLNNISVGTGCPRKHDSLWIVLNVFFHNFLSSLIPKRIIKIIAWKCNYYKIDFKAKYNWVKDFSKINCKKSLKYNTSYERRHSKLFTNCHVSLDTLYVDLQRTMVRSFFWFTLSKISFFNWWNVLLLGADIDEMYILLLGADIDKMYYN